MVEICGEKTMNFQDAPMKREGQPMFDLPPSAETDVDITWIERRVPRHLSHALDLMIDKFLRDRGFDPKEI